MSERNFEAAERLQQLLTFAANTFTTRIILSFDRNNGYATGDPVFTDNVTLVKIESDWFMTDDLNKSEDTLVRITGTKLSPGFQILLGIGLRRAFISFVEGFKCNPIALWYSQIKRLEFLWSISGVLHSAKLVSGKDGEPKLSGFNLEARHAKRVEISFK